MTREGKALAVSLGVLVGLLLLAPIFVALWVTGHGEVATNPVHNLPACLEEDGSTQQECMWDDGSGLIVHNWDWGKHYATYART